MQQSTKSCQSKGCERAVRYRPFKGSTKEYVERTCRSCQGTQRRHGLTKPEWDAVKQFRKNGGG